MVEVRWMWLPTFIGINHAAMTELEKALTNEFMHTKATEQQMDLIDAWVMDWLCKKFPIPGLREYLTAISHV